MAGTGVRFGSQTPKQFHRLAGKKVYLHTLGIFIKSKLFDEVVLMCPPDWIEKVKEEVGASATVVEGGSTRQESSYLGLLACGVETEIVVIHDAVRPFVSEEILKENVDQAMKWGAVDTCIPSTDTLVHSFDRHKIDAIPNRTEFLRGQTPQSFHYDLIVKAHRESSVSNQSDDCSLVLNMGHPIHVVAGSEENIKITSELDLILAEQILRLRSRTGYEENGNSLKGKKYVVTGGSGGIGKAVCKLLEEEGAIPVSVSRSSPFAADLTCFDEARAIFDRIGPVDGLINSVGFLKIKRFDLLDKEEIDRLIAANLTSILYSCKCALLNNGSHIVNIASSSYVRGKENYALYASAKAAVVNFTQGLAEERPDLIVNAVVPQRTNTAMRVKNFPGEDANALLDPIDVAKEIVKVLKQRTMTGTVVEVKKE